MKLDNNLRSFVPGGVLYTVIFFLLINITQNTDVTTTLLISILTGSAYILGLYLLSRIRAAHGEKVYRELSLTKRVICRGLAVQNRRGAWMYLTEDALEIYFDKIDINGKKAVIALKDITCIKQKNGTHLQITVTGRNYEFTVCRASEWERVLTEQKAKFAEEHPVDEESMEAEQYAAERERQKRLREEKVTCPKCGFVQTGDRVVCWKCGLRL